MLVLLAYCYVAALMVTVFDILLLLCSLFIMFASISILVINVKQICPSEPLLASSLASSRV